MRSRFTAFSVGDADYLLRSWDPSTRPATLSLDDGTVWKRLTILEVSADDDGSTGIVEFAASYVHGGEPGTLRERSSFRRLDGAWVYVGPLS